MRNQIHCVTVVDKIIFTSKIITDIAVRACVYCREGNKLKISLHPTSVHPANG